MATAGVARNIVSVFLGTGSGNFGPATTFPAGNSPLYVVTGDFNSDNKLDLVVANTGTTISLLLGTGTGSFDSPIPFTVGSTPSSIVASDFDKDGKLDIATANNGSNNISVLLGTGTGSSVDDFNRDGNLDFVVLNLFPTRTTSALQIRLGNGDGTFGAVTNISLLINVSVMVTAGDLNGDGKPDLFVAGLGSTSNGVPIGIVAVLQNCSGGLPVDLYSLQGKSLPEGAKLSWKTAWERSNKGFEIQKSSDALQYKAIGWVDGISAGSQSHTYEFIDQSFSETSYYRLKQLDFDGSYTLTRSIVIVSENESISKVQAYPNPSLDGYVTIQLPVQVTSLQLLDEVGREIYQIHQPGTKQAIELPKSGVYLLYVKTALEQKSLKLTRP